jgi:hypothetical protein
MTMKPELQKKIKEVQKLVKEIAQEKEFSDSVKQIGKSRLEGKHTTRGTCFNGCASCLPCLATPTPDLELMVGFTIHEFY